MKRRNLRAGIDPASYRRLSRRKLKAAPMSKGKASGISRFDIARKGEAAPDGPQVRFLRGFELHRNSRFSKRRWVRGPFNPRNLVYA
jgi:hypothetical protein